MKHAVIINAQGETLQGLQATVASVFNDIKMNHEFSNSNNTKAVVPERYSLSLQDMKLAKDKNIKLMVSLKPIPSSHQLHDVFQSENIESLAKQKLGVDFVKLLQGIIDDISPLSSGMHG